MVERLYLKENLSFDIVDLNFQNGLILFTGPSGAGKSVLMNSLLSTLGLSESRAKLAELVFSDSIDLEPYGVEGDDVTVFKQIKKEKLRFFINSQTVSKKVVSEIGKQYIKHLTPRDADEFKQHSLLTILDSMGSEKLQNSLNSYRELYSEYEKLKKKIRLLNSEIEEIESREEFIKFEIEKIDLIDPKSGEDEELYRTRKMLSKKDKIESYLQESEDIFEKVNSIYEIFDLMGLEEELNENRDFFENLKGRLDEVEDELSELDSFDVEDLLNRIETLSELKEKYGTIEGGLQYRDQKRKELDNFYELREEREGYKAELKELETELTISSKELSELRVENLPIFQESLNSYLSLLNLQTSVIDIKETPFGENGSDMVQLSVGGSDLTTLSYGEQNRLRLALLTLQSKFNNSFAGVLFLDEIDANLSGDESMRVAQVLKELSESYQIFAISHQPQLTSKADQHFLVYRDSENSKRSVVQELQTVDERADEIVRMVGGGDREDSVKQFAKKLLEEGR